MKRFLPFLFLLGLCLPAYSAEGQDVCNWGKHQSVAIAQSSATTTELVALAAGKAVYVCGFSMSIAASATAAASAKFVTGNGSNCGSNQVSLTGTFGSGDAAVAPTPAVINYGDGTGTLFAGTNSFALCITTAGTAVLTQGVVTFVQQ